MKKLVAGGLSAVVMCFLALAPARATPVLDVIFGMDTSGSLGTANWVEEQNLVKSIITTGLVRDHTRAGVLSFATGAAEEIPLTLVTDASVGSLTDDVDDIVYTQGSTYTKSAVQLAIDMFDAQSVVENPKLFFLITDGNPNPITQRPCSLSSTLQAQNIKVVILGIGDQWNPDTLACLVNNPETDIVFIDDFNEAAFDAVLPDILDLIAESNVVPAPATGLIFAGGLALAAWRRRRAA